MNKLIFAASVIAAMNFSLYASDFDVRVSGRDGEISGFGVSVGEYYRAPIEEVRVVRRSLPNEELSVVYYLARKSHRNPEYIGKMRANGRSWWDITLALGLEPRSLYMHDKHSHRKNYRLRDVEVIEVVNTRFLSSYHRVNANEIYEKRRSGRGYEDIDGDYRDRKEQKYKEYKYERREDNDRKSERKNDNNRHGEHNDRGHSRDRN